MSNIRHSSISRVGLYTPADTNRKAPHLILSDCCGTKDGCGAKKRCGVKDRCGTKDCAQLQINKLSERTMYTYILEYINE